MHITPRKKAKLRFYTILVLFSTLTLLTFLKLWNSDGSQANSVLTKEKFYVVDDLYNNENEDSNAGSDRFENGQHVVNEHIINTNRKIGNDKDGSNEDAGVQAVGIKTNGLREKAPGGVDYFENRFKENINALSDKNDVLENNSRKPSNAAKSNNIDDVEIADNKDHIVDNDPDRPGIEAPGLKGSRNTETGPKGFEDSILDMTKHEIKANKTEGVDPNKMNEKGGAQDAEKNKEAILRKTGGMLPLINQSYLNMDLFTNKEPLIPHIIHQTWDTYEVPEAFIPWIKSVVNRHPAWKYMFWTQEDVQCYFKQKHTDFYDVYNSYWATIFKTDVMRYFLLYDYGGFYLDLDVESLQPLDIWTHYSSCILTHETYEQVFLLKDIDVLKPNVMTTVLACRPFHPYYKMLQENLVKYRDMYKKDVLRATGPHFMQTILDEYQMLTNTTLRNDEVTIINPSYWLPTFDPVLSTKISYKCLNKIKYLRRFAKDLCHELMRNEYRNKPLDISYLDHHWVHTNLKPSTFKTTNLVDIRKVIPNLVSVQEALDFKC